MGLVVNTNIAAINASRVLRRSTLALNKSLERLSSGLRINRAADDAAGPLCDLHTARAGALVEAIRVDLVGGVQGDVCRVYLVVAIVIEAVANFDTAVALGTRIFATVTRV